MTFATLFVVVAFVLIGVPCLIIVVGLALLWLGVTVMKAIFRC